MERIPTNGLTAIYSGEYETHFDSAQRLFLAGDLKLPNPHPFFRDRRIEIIACRYKAGDDGFFHWHTNVTEYEYVVEGSMAYEEAATGDVRCFSAGDLRLVPAGVC